MKWRDFVKEVNRQIKEQGEDPKEIEIDKIEWPCGYSEDVVEVTTMKNGKMDIYS